MKNFFSIILSLLLALWGNASYASHSVGANITYTCLGTNLYQVKLTFYRDCSGVSPSNPMTVYWAGCGNSGSISLPQVGAALDVTPVCPSQATSCSGGGAYGIQQYTFQANLTLPAGCNNVSLSWSECCRNAAITTLTDPDYENIYVTSMINNTVTPCNSSPQFTNIPTPIICINQPYIFNHGAVDPDGDVLVYSLVNCLEGSGNNVNYGGGYSGVTPLTTSGGMTINSSSGAISFTPSIIQVGVICVRVEEFRGGVKVGEVIRDLQFRVINCSNVSPTATGVNATNNYTASVCQGGNLCFGINMADANAGNLVTANWNAGISGASFTISNNNTGTPTGTFCWTPTAGDVGVHYFTVSVEDNACPITGNATYTYTITVNPSPNTIDAGTNAAICAGGISNTATTLNATTTGGAATSYSWSPATGLSATNVANPTATPTSTTAYTVFATFPNGCVLPDNVTITVNPAPTVTVNPPSSFGCPSSSIQLVASGATTYSWSPPTFLSATTGATVNVNNPTSTTTYTVFGTQTGCTGSATAVVNVNVPAGTSCNVLYVTTSANANPAIGVGTQAAPATLINALNLAACNNTVIKMATGLYTISTPIINVTSNLTIEGGFNSAGGWIKSSTQGATTITRTVANIEDPTGVAPRLVAFYINGQSGFRFQDLTITVDDAPNAINTKGASTYGVHLTNCSNYLFVRCRVAAGWGGDGINGVAGVAGLTGTGANGGGGGSCDGNGSGGTGGAGGAGAGTGFGGGGAAMPNPGGNGNTGPAGNNGAVSTNARAGGGGGSGGAGGETDHNGGNGGQGGGVNFGANNTTIGGGAGWGDPGGDGGGGTTGAAGAAGATGAAGSAGFYASGFWNPGNQGGTGTNGAGGKGGSGGGGGGGQSCTFCNDGSGNGGGGGGGGGQGGTGGTGGYGGGSSYGIMFVSNGAGAQFTDCNITSDFVGFGGNAGSGASGGFGGSGALGATTCTSEVGQGGNGAAGGGGGAGAAGGAGSNGISTPMYVLSGTVPAVTNNGVVAGVGAGANNVATFGLAGQPTITVTNISCINTNLTYTTTAGAPVWSLVGGTPSAGAGTPINTQYATTGRKDVNMNGNIYAGFTNILQAGSINPLAATNAPFISGQYRICAGQSVDFSALNGGTNYIYSWDMGGGSTPNTYNGTAFDVVNGAVFPTAGTYTITLFYTTDCCGLSNPTTITLIVEPQPIQTPPANAAFCDGGAGVTLTTGGGSSYVWSPGTGLSATTGATVTAVPPTTTTYTIIAYNATGLCSDADNVTVTVNNPVLSLTPTNATCGPNGSIGSSIASGSGSYTYSWSNGATTAMASNLLAGTYVLYITDNNTGCQRNSSAAITSSQPVSANIMATTAPLCNGATTGTATVNVSSVAAGFIAISWTPSSNSGFVNNSGSMTATALPAGTHTAYIVPIGAPACSTIVTTTITQPNPLAASVIASTDPICQQSNGTATVDGTGGTGPYSYSWHHDGNLTSSDNNLADNITYNITVTDGNGCNTVTSVLLGGCTFPIELLYLTASPEDNYIKVEWQSAAEQYLVKYELQRALDGVAFEPIATLNAEGAGHIYRFDDEKVVPRQLYYYRLRGLDNDGLESFSNIVEAKLPTDAGYEVLGVYPNPTQDALNVELYLTHNANVQFVLFNELGQNVARFIQDYPSGTQKIQMNIQHFAAGVYYGKLIVEDEKPISLKVVKTNE